MLFQEEVGESGHYDVIVAGGGVAGTAAAVAAARLGKKVLLIEKSMKLGGLATLGLINLFVPMCNGRGKQIIFGMAEEFASLSYRDGYGGPPPEFVNGRVPEELLQEYRTKKQLPPRYAFRFSADIFALELTELCKNEGVDLLFDTLVCRTVPGETEGTLAGVLVQNQSGAQYYRAEMFVDATGDGVLMRRAGIPTRSRGNYHTYIGLMISLESCRAALESGNIGRATQHLTGGDINLYGDNQPKDIPLYHAGDAGDMNRYIVSNQLEMLRRLRTQDRKSRDIVALPGMAQFRTTCCIDGDSILRETDSFRHFDDSVGAICDFDRRDYLYEVPFGALTKKGFRNVITAGRSAAGDGYGWDVLRVIPPAIITGQAAGIACSHAIDEGKAIWEIGIPSLQAELSRENVMIHFDDADIPSSCSDTHEHND